MEEENSPASLETEVDNIVIEKVEDSEQTVCHSLHSATWKTFHSPKLQP